MAFLQSASDLAKQLFAQFQQKAVQPAQTAVGNAVRPVLQNIGQAEVNAEKNVPLYGQLQAGIRNTVAPVMRNFTSPQQVQQYQSFSQPNRSGIAGNVAQFVGGQVPYIPLMMATDGVANPITSRIAATIPAGKTIATAALSGAAKGAVRTAPFGWMGGLNYANTPQERLQNIGKSTLENTALGGGLGAVGGVGKYALGAIADAFPKATPAVQKALSQAYARDVQTGRFKPAMDSGKGKAAVQDWVRQQVGKQPGAPVFHSDLKQALEKNIPQPGLSLKTVDSSKLPELSDTQKYIQELTAKQQAAGSTGKVGLVQKGKDFLSNVKTQFVDSASPIEDAVSMAEKKNGFQVRPTNDVRLQIDRVLRSKSLASQFAEDNGLTDVIKQAPDLNALDQYMIAKQAARVGELGKTTGRDSVRDAQLVKDLGPQYEPLAQKVNQYSRNLLDYSVKSGLIDKNLAAELTKKYPDYVPLNRVFNELEQNGYQGAGKSIANLSKQTVVQKLEGSTREIQSPIESLLLKTQTAFDQGEKNVAAKQLASYKDLPGLSGLIKPVTSTGESPHTFSYLENGVKKTFATTPEIAAAAKNLNAQQMNIVTKILSVPTRVLQLGATGLNTPFAATNLLKDQIDAFINSNRAAKTSILNPSNFLQALFAATKHNDLYKEANRNAAILTSFDISRAAPDLAVNKIRASGTIGGQIAYTARHPAELLRELENLIGRTEELTRVQNYKGHYQAMIQEGRTPEDARLLAAQAARTNTANFARHGDLGKVINYVIPFFNASIQGSRTFVNAAKNNPVGTGAKLATSLFLPMAATTMWSMTDPARKQVYDDIQESDKEKNLIIIPNGSAKDANGKYNVIKIPLPSGLAPLASLVRRGIEQTHGGNPVAIKEVFDALVGGATPFDTSNPTKFVGGLTPQAIKPLVEGVTNTNLYTGNKIVPDSMKNLPPDQQVKPSTSPIAKAIGGATRQSPLMVENAARTALGGVGGQLLGQNPVQQLQGRFTQASSGEQQNKQFSDIQKYQQAGAVDSQKKKAALTKVAGILLDPNADPEQKTKLVQAISKDKALYGQLKQEIRDQKQGVTPADRAVRGLSTKERASYIKDQLKSLSTDEKRKLVIQYVNKGILTKDVVKELKLQLSKAQQ